MSGCQGPRGENIVNMIYNFIQGQLAVSFKFFFCVSGEENCGLMEKGKGSVSTYCCLSHYALEIGSFPQVFHFHTACDYSDRVMSILSQISFVKCPNGYGLSMEKSSAHPSCLGSLVPLGFSGEGVLQRCACHVPAMCLWASGLR